MTKLNDDARDALELPARATRFLAAVSRQAAIFERLKTGGYTAADQEAGASHLQRALERPASDPDAAPQPPETRPRDLVRAARRALVPVRSGLLHHHPEQARAVFGRGRLEDLVDVVRALERLAAMHDGETRSPEAYAADEGARALATARGLGPDATRGYLALLSRFQAGAVSRALATPLEPPPPQDRLADLRRWLNDWTVVARAVVTRRDHLISLGLSVRREKRA